MSHFTVTVHITESRLAQHGGDFNLALKEMLAPYQENNMGTCPRQFMEFIDAGDPPLEEGETREQVMKEDGYKQHPDDPKRWGYWENPNRKWDWWLVGGRWRGFYPTKPGVAPIVGEAGSFDNESRGGSDVVTVDQIDMDAVAAKEREAFDKFKAERVRLIAGETFDTFKGPRSKMLDLGLLRVERDPNAPLQADEVQIGKTWGETHPNFARETGPDSRAGWRDVAKFMPDDQLEKYRCAFNPLMTWAALDDLGWHESGKMGWFGCSSSTPDLYLAYAETFMEFIHKVGPKDLLVVVDCHI